MIFGKWYAWQGTTFLLSDEETKTLHSFRNIDDCVNWLWLNGEKEAARELNKGKVK